MSGFDEAAEAIAARIEQVLDAAAADLAARLDTKVSIETATGLRRIEMRDADAVTREFGDTRTPAEPFVDRALDEGGSDLVNRLKETLRDDP